MALLLQQLDPSATYVAPALVHQQEHGGSVAHRLLHDMAHMNEQRIESSRAASVAAGSAAPAIGAASADSAAKPKPKRRAARQAAGPAAAARKPKVVARKATADQASAQKRSSADMNNENTRKCFRVHLANGTSNGFNYSSEEDKEAARQSEHALAASHNAQ